MARRIRAGGVLRLRSVNGTSQNAIARSPILLARMLVPLYVSTFFIEKNHRALNIPILLTWRKLLLYRWHSNISCIYECQLKLQ